MGPTDANLALRRRSLGAKSGPLRLGYSEWAAGGVVVCRVAPDLLLMDAKSDGDAPAWLLGSRLRVLFKIFAMTTPLLQMKACEVWPLVVL